MYAYIYIGEEVFRSNTVYFTFNIASSLNSNLYANIYSIVWVDSKVPALQSRKPPVYCEYNSIYIEEQERNQEKTFYVCCFLCC